MEKICRKGWTCDSYGAKIKRIAGEGKLRVAAIMFFRKKKTKEYDKENKKPVLRCSICTGEQVAGFKDINSGVFEEEMMISGPKE